MKKKCNRYTSEDISRFIDRELPLEQYRSFKHHLPHCRDCSDLLNRYQSVSFAFSHYTDRMTQGIRDADIEQKLEKAFLAFEKKSLKDFSGLFGKNIYLKLASITAIIMICLFPFNLGLLKDPSAGPSAIVNSVDTEYTSVMIIETQKQKHTIIWFLEET